SWRHRSGQRRWRGAGEGGRVGRGETMPEVPQNGGYALAAYIVTAAILLGYALSLHRRTRRR
ncbi:MAG TPA: hypothetical protein VIW28_11225, partial [Gemmatimonadales bacterium]